MSARRYRFGPLEQRAVVGPLRAGQVAIVAAGALTGLGALYAMRSIVGLIVGVLALCIAVAAICVPFEGRTAEEWAPVLGRWARRLKRAERGHRSTAPSGGTRLGGEGEGEHETSLPPELAGVELLAVPYGSEQVGVISDRRDGTFTAALAVRAGAFAMRDGAEQERALDAWGAVLASCARDGCPIRRLQWLEQTVPGQGDELAAHFQAQRDRAVPLDSEVVRSYIELVESAAPQTTEHEVLIAVQIDQRRGARELRRLGGGVEAACELLLREAESLAERLTIAEVSVSGLLRPRQYAALIRDAFDPFGRQARARATLGQDGREGVEPALMGPLADEASWSTYRTDSAFHATYWIASWPRSDVGPMFMAPLLMQTSALRTVAVTIEPVPYSLAMRRAEAAQTAEVAEEINRSRQGFMSTARIRRRQQAASRREEELADGHAEMRWAGYVRTSARSPQELERAESEVEHAAQLARLGLQRLYGEQDTGFPFTLPLCRGLR
ncbi:MAG TPA: SCO6880 family protein [Solirubrobacterales bacterium]|nr:SCO6880 family protein [Solirubrobacterales bacterium]